ncbi:sulfur carrier protein [Roseinatronobacter thiooxidans]|uniref:Sulfur carrier protein n=1 Tax=Roseinatronobacter thiooxidans TaxID=121821 RepID=A0A2W7QVS2_9RHOB|nr:sulfur carrier protein ThiS [Roseinatronobacter thiooxidans]PZX45689.1 sulfur carrier protein [Roseinatronobacter thiooxidans]
MKIEVNGEMREIAADTLEGALSELDWGTARVATALNGAFVPKSARADTRLQNGDRLEVLAPMQGG